MQMSGLPPNFKLPATVSSKHGGKETKQVGLPPGFKLPDTVRAPVASEESSGGGAGSRSDDTDGKSDDGSDDGSSDGGDTGVDDDYYTDDGDDDWTHATPPKRSKPNQGKPQTSEEADTLSCPTCWALTLTMTRNPPTTSSSPRFTRACTRSSKRTTYFLAA